MKYKYLLFDADNTLFDFDLAEKQAFKSLSAIVSKAFGEDTYELYHMINDKYWKLLEMGATTRESLKTDRFCEYFRSVGIYADDALVRIVSNAYLDALGRGNILIDGASEILEYLFGSYEIYIITNGTSAVQRRRFDSSDIRKYVNNVFISEEIGYDKPHTQYFEHVLDAIGDHDKEKFLVIGDSLSSDITGAVNFGIDSIFFDRYGKGAGTLPVNYTINSLTRLKTIL